MRVAGTARSADRGHPARRWAPPRCAEHVLRSRARRPPPARTSAGSAQLPKKKKVRIGPRPTCHPPCCRSRRWHRCIRDRKRSGRNRTRRSSSSPHEARTSAGRPMRGTESLAFPSTDSGRSGVGVQSSALSLRDWGLAIDSAICNENASHLDFPRRGRSAPPVAKVCT